MFLLRWALRAPGFSDPPGPGMRGNFQSKRWGLAHGLLDIFSSDRPLVENCLLDKLTLALSLAVARLNKHRLKIECSKMISINPSYPLARLVREIESKPPPNVLPDQQFRVIISARAKEICARFERIKIINQSIHLSTCLSSNLSVGLSVHLSMCLSISLPICLSIYLSKCLPICLYVYLSIYMPICLSIYLNVYLYVYMSIYHLYAYLPIYLSVSLYICETSMSNDTMKG